MADLVRWQPVNAWAGIAAPGRGGAANGDAGVRIEPVDALHVLSIVARPGRRDDLARLVADGFGVPLPAAGRFTTGHGGELVWSGLDHWLAVTPDAMAPTLRREVGSVAAVTDQTSARALLRVSGLSALDTLAKGFAIDLHPMVFAPGCTAVTSVAHIGVQIWQPAAGTYTIAVPRSFASSFWAWLTASAAPYGYEIFAA